MDSLIEKEYILTFGKKKIDVSNVSAGKKEYARTEWNKFRETEFDELAFNQLCERLGMSMIVQDFDVLRLRLPFWKSVKSFFERITLTLKHVRKSNQEEYNKFIDWVYFALTGDKKKDLITDRKILEMSREFYKIGERKGQTPEECAALLWTSLQELQKL